MQECAMFDDDTKILAALEKVMTNAEIATATGINRADVGPALKRLRAAGLIVSRGATNKRIHMRMASAIEMLFERTDELQLQLNRMLLPKRPSA
jgi:transcription initiation factor IIE alpha subunit